MRSPPLITLFVFTYNQENFIRESIESALSQDYSPLEIIISDDNSTDHSLEIINEVVSQYKGPHQVCINTNSKNLGIGKHVNKSFTLARGEFIIFAAGDDISLSHRVSRIVARWELLNRKVSAIYCGAKIIDEFGVHHGILKTAFSHHISLDTVSLLNYRIKNSVHLLMGACGSYSSNLNSAFGDLNDDLNIEDIPLTIRASLLNGVSYIDEELVLYRKNVSVWHPRKLKNETYLNNRKRLLYLIKSRYAMEKQIYKDVKRISANQRIVKISFMRLVLADFNQKCVNEKKFLLGLFFRNLIKTRYWFDMLFPTIFIANPNINFIAYKLYRFLKRD
ncbi:glycosyltransferase [Acinetobacter faecalis]|uniref:glycosyltransferase n=1 Tax=Acinetobacter faecalis TaxID=2665161 RepID=UPI002A91B4FB|nr:glycosyltransferase [Acinetobacter faecalis]MDY6449399.1 glycosyltransferase [Acinetobacter faecalis]